MKSDGLPKNGPQIFQIEFSFHAHVLHFSVKLCMKPTVRTPEIEHLGNFP